MEISLYNQFCDTFLEKAIIKSIFMYSLKSGNKFKILFLKVFWPLYFSMEKKEHVST